MKVVKSRYNVLTVDFGTLNALINVSGVTVVGTENDYDIVKRITDNSGLIKIKAVLGDDTNVDCTATCYVVNATSMIATALKKISGATKVLEFTFQRNSGKFKVTFAVRNPS